jgi:hypothetical protein
MSVWLRAFRCHVPCAEVLVAWKESTASRLAVAACALCVLAAHAHPRV